MRSRIRFEQGLAGGRSIARGDDVLIVVVDVLSFSTCVTVALDRGIEVIPVRWRDERAAAVAREHDAVLAGPRGGPGVSLSPASIRGADGMQRLVLPSPNGATLSSARTAWWSPAAYATHRRSRACARCISSGLLRPPSR